MSRHGEEAWIEDMVESEDRLREGGWGEEFARDPHWYRQLVLRMSHPNVVFKAAAEMPVWMRRWLNTYVLALSVTAPNEWVEARLTAREMATLHWSRRGLSIPQIADALDVHPDTAEKLASKARRKLHA
jgi:hypothetical protein